MGYVGAAVIGEALKVNTSLRRFHLSGNNIGDVGGTEIGEALKQGQHFAEEALQGWSLTRIRSYPIQYSFGART